MVASHGTGVGQAPANRSRAVTRYSACLLLGCSVFACDASDSYKVGKLEDAEGASPADDAGSPSSAPIFPQTGINASKLTVTGITPTRGPFSGGNTATVRGSGFTDKSLVFIGGHMVQPADTILQDRNSLIVVVPASRSGVADVRVEVESQSAELDDAYAYNALALDPTNGSIAGGTSVLLTTESVRFDAGEPRVEFGGVPCSDLRVVTPSQVRCKSPAGQPGSVDVSIAAQSPTDEPPLLAEQAFEYVDLTDTDRGGLSGGPMQGTLNVTVVDSLAQLAVPEAFVLVGDALSAPYQGRTDSRGQITFSGEDLVGPISVHVSAKCMERASIVGFDAANVTVHVAPLPDPTCGSGSGEPPPPGRGTAGSFISGQLIFGGQQEFSALAWDAVPKPRTNEVRVAYVFTTRSSPQSANPTPSLNGTLARVLEASPALGDRGYLYRIFARPAALAVYAIAGVERRDTNDFVPYVMGVARSVLTSPGEEVEHVDIEMNIPLDRELQVDLSRIPRPKGHTPEYFRIRSYLDLGAEGAVVRQIGGHMVDLLTTFEAGKPFRFFAQPPLSGELDDARFGLIAGWYSGEEEGIPPYSELRRTGFAQSDAPLIVDDMLGIPEVVQPLFGARIPDDRTLRWQIAGQRPDMFVIKMTGGDGMPAWTQIVAGSRDTSVIPDLSSVEGLTDIAPGAIPWQVRAVRIEDFVFDEFRYSLLHPRLWSHSSLDEFMMRR